MAVPKRKPSTQRQGKRRGTQLLKLPTLTPCPECGKPKRPHEVCPHCGYYNKKKALEIKEKRKKKSA